MGICDRIVGDNIPGDKFLHDIWNGREIPEKGVKLLLVVQPAGIAGPHAGIRLDNYRITNLLQKFFRRLPCPDSVAAGGRYAGLGVIRLHAGLASESGGGPFIRAGGDMEICAEPGILFQPVFIIGFQPVNFPIFKGKKGHCAKHLTIILHAVHTVIFRQRPLQGLFQFVIRRIADAQHRNAVPAQPVAEIPIGTGKLWGNKNKIHIGAYPFH